MVHEGGRCSCDADDRPDWDTWALGIAAAVARRADCTRRQVGAVVLDRDHRVVAVGYNGAPAGRPGCASAGACPRGKFTHAQLPPDAPYSNCIAVHAEANAVIYAPRSSLVGATVYTTDAPCHECRRLLMGAGVARAVWPGGEEDLTT